ncbi:MAG: FIST C-terminal domain-containing protein [Candidatus Diapherotrites archaeon]|nr:FIST C-terminal domain-containing protein [Candidatus Diapherotrites archaeon]
MKAGVGISKNKNSFKAGEEAAKQAVKGSGKPNFVVVFSTERFQQKQLLSGIRSVTSSAKLAGCCGAGVIAGEELSKDAVVVMAMRGSPASVGIGKGISKGPHEAGRDSVAGLKKPGTIIFLPDGLTGNVTKVVAGAHETLGAAYRLVGGGAGDNLKFIKTYQFINDEVHSDAVVTALLGQKVGVGIAHGWTPIGEPMIVTKAKGNVVHEIDGRPALDAYKKQFPGDRISAKGFAKFAAEHPLGMPQRTGEYLIRDPLMAEKDGSIKCVAEVPENSAVRIMQGDKQSLIAAAEQAARQAMAGVKKPGALLVFDCVSRLLFLGDDAKTEVKAVRDIVGNVPTAGFFTFGEVGSTAGPPMFHNKTIVVCVLPE